MLSGLQTRRVGTLFPHSCPHSQMPSKFNFMLSCSTGVTGSCRASGEAGSAIGCGSGSALWITESRAF